MLQKVPDNPLVCPRRSPHPLALSVRRRTCAPRLRRPCWKLDPARVEEPEAAPDWVERVGVVWIVYLWYGVPEGNSEDLSYQRRSMVVYSDSNAGFLSPWDVYGQLFDY